MVTNNALISIVIPVYNVEKYLEQCILSVTTQTYSNLQIILVNDGSTDKSRELCALYAAKDNRIEVIDQPNGGVAHARNTGIDAVRGEYFCFVDSDDFLDPKYIEVLHGHSSDNDLVICNATLYRTGNKVESVSQQELTNFESIKFTRLEMLQKIHRFKRPLVIVLWNKLYKTQVWGDLRFPSGFLHEDEFIIHRLIDKCNSIQFINIPLYYYRQDVANSIMDCFSQKRFDDYILALKDREQFYTENDLLNLAKEVHNLKRIFFYKKSILLPGNNANSVSLTDIIKDEGLFLKNKFELCLSILAKRLKN